MTRRQIPFLHWRRLADGTEVADWKPSPRLVRAGWSARRLGTRAEEEKVLLAALELNRQVAEWDGGAREAAVPPPPRKWRFGDLVSAYRQSPEFLDEIRQSTRNEYEVRLRQLEYWAQEGRLPVAALDRDMVKDLKAALLANGGSRFKCASTLRVLRLLLNWAKANRVVAHNATDGVRIPSTPSRTDKLTWPQVQACVAAAGPLADRLAGFDAALAFAVGFWSMQRESDLRLLTRMAWRDFEAMDPRDRAVLADPRGVVKGFRLQQRKTRKWVDCPMPPWLHEPIDAAFARGQYLFPDPRDAERPCHEKRWQRAFRAVLDQAGFPAHQCRDLRRSGMVWTTDMGARESAVFAISGHGVLGKRTIVDTYMPPDTPAACAAIAAALRTMARLEELEKEG